MARRFQRFGEPTTESTSEINISPLIDVVFFLLIFFGGREIGVAGVRSTISRLIRQEEMPVIIQADRDTPTESTIQVLDEAKLAGAKRVFVSTIDD